MDALNRVFDAFCSGFNESEMNEFLSRATVFCHNCKKEFLCLTGAACNFCRRSDGVPVWICKDCTYYIHSTKGLSYQLPSCISCKIKWTNLRIKYSIK